METAGSDRIDGFVGADLLFQQDVELDLAKLTLQFFSATDCPNRFLDYWANYISMVDVEPAFAGDLRQIVPVVINGVKARAMVDSGADRSVIDTHFAARLGITAESLNVVRQSHQLKGVGTHALDSWVMPVVQFSIGDESIQNTRIEMADLWSAVQQDIDLMATSGYVHAQPDMLLEADFLQSHRVLFAISQRHFYFRWPSGKVFKPD